MNKIILARFQDDRFSLIFEPLVSELLMIKLVLAWICLANRCTFSFCLLVTFHQKENFKFKTQVFLGGFQLPDSYVWVLVGSQICRLLIKILSFIIGL
jgi:hypothetical protein